MPSFPIRTPLAGGSSRLLPVVPLTLLLAVTAMSAACSDGDEAQKNAEVTIVSVDPEGGYPGVETAVSFTIAAGADTSAGELSWRLDFGDGRIQSGDGLDGEVRHTYERSGEFQIRVDALAGSQVAGSATRTYRVYDPVDLSATNVTGRPSNVRTGEQLTVSLDVVNLTAAQIETPFFVTAYLSPSPQVSVEALGELVELGSTHVTAEGEDGSVMAAGSTRSIGVTGDVPEALDGGDYYAVAVVDIAGQVADTDRTNNLAVSSSIVRVENVAQILPDISVEDVYALPDRAYPELNRVTRGFLLANRGPEEIFNVVHRTYLSVGSPELTDDSVLIHTSEPVSLAPRSEQHVGPDQFVLNEAILPPADSDLEVYVIVEARSEDGDVVEIRDDNNVRPSTNPIIVSDQLVEGPDISVREFTVSPESTFLNGSIEVHAVIGNEGNTDAGSFFCGIYMGREAVVRADQDPRLANINIASLPSAEERPLTRSITIPSLYDPGTYYFYIVCDPLGAIGESFRSNNSQVYPNPIQITDEADIDLYVDELTVPQAADEGTAVELVASICVAGSNPSGVTRAQLYRSTGNQVDFTATPVLTFDVPNITPGRCIEVPIEVEASCSEFQGRYAYGIVVDANDRLPEIDENNNRRAGSNPMTVEGLYCSCVEDGFAPNNRPLNAAPVTDGTYSAAVCNPGACDYFAVELDARDSLIVSTNFLAEKGALSTSIYAPNGVQRLDEDSTPDHQQVGVFLVPSAARYVVAVCGAQSTSRNYYDFDVEVVPQSDAIDVMPRNVQLPVRDSFSVGATFDVRFRAYNLGRVDSGAFEAQVVLTGERSTGNAEDIVLASRTLTSLAGGAFDDITIPVTLPPAVSDGDYYLAVVLDPADAIGDSDPSNNVAFSRRTKIETRCYDGLEPNNTFAEARELDAGSYSNLVACADNNDYYKVCVGDAKQFSASAIFDDSQGDIDMELYDAEFKLIASSASSGTDIEQVTVPYVNGAQCYYVRVYMISLDREAQNTYTLDIDVRDVDPSLQCESFFEPNNSFASASSLLAAVHHEQTLDRCPVADTDYYYVNLTAGQRVSFRGILEPANQPGTLRLQLYRPNQTPGPNVETAPGVPVAEIANYVAPLSGRFYLQVTIGGNARRVTYSLEADGLSGIDLQASNLAIGPGTYRAEDTLRFGFDLTNLLSTTVSAPAYAVYLSTTATLDPDEATLLGTFTAPAVAGSATVRVEGQTALPDTVTAGGAFVHVLVDPDEAVADLNRANNVTAVPITLVD